MNATKTIEERLTELENRVSSLESNNISVDTKFEDVVKEILQFEQISASFIQRKFKMGYSRAARLLDELEKAGYVGPAKGAMPREVLKKK